MVITEEAMEPTPEEVQDVYTSNGRIRNEISHEKERVIELSTAMAKASVSQRLRSDDSTIYDNGYRTQRRMGEC